MSILDFLENLYRCILNYVGEHEKMIYLVCGAVVLLVAIHQMFMMYINENYGQSTQVMSHQ